MLTGFAFCCQHWLCNPFVPVMSTVWLKVLFFLLVFGLVKLLSLCGLKQLHWLTMLYCVSMTHGKIYGRVSLGDTQKQEQMLSRCKFFLLLSKHINCGVKLSANLGHFKNSKPVVFSGLWQFCLFFSTASLFLFYIELFQIFVCSEVFLEPAASAYQTSMVYCRSVYIPV